MKTLFKAILTVLLLGVIYSRAEGQGYDSNTLSTALADAAQHLGWPTDPVADSITLTNYSGGTTNLIILSGGNNPIIMTNLTTHSSFTLHQNGHLSIFDQFGSSIETHTNSQFVISNATGLVVSISNGFISVSSGGVPAGLLSISNLMALSMSTSNLTANVLSQPLGIYMPTNGTFSIYAITNVETNVPVWFWAGASNNSLITLKYNKGTLTFSNLQYFP